MSFSEGTSWIDAEAARGRHKLDTQDIFQGEGLEKRRRKSTQHEVCPKNARTEESMSDVIVPVFRKNLLDRRRSRKQATQTRSIRDLFKETA